LLSTPPRKWGPPESPKQVPPLPVEGFSDRFSHARWSDRKNCVAYRRVESKKNAFGPPVLSTRILSVRGA
jgi:hypothetical protein